MRSWSWSHEVLPPIIVVAAGLVAYHASFHGVFLFDDISWVVENPDLDRLWPPTAAGGLSLRPVLLWSLALNRACSGLETWSYHAVNVTVHLLAGLALLGVLRRLLARSDRQAGARATGLALAAAVLWIVHPLTTQAVDYVIQRGEALAALSLLLVLYCFLRAQTAVRPWLWYAAILPINWLGLGCKETAIVAPVLLYLLDAAVVSGNLWRPLRRRWWLYLGLPAFPVGIVTFWVLQDPQRLAYLAPNPLALGPGEYAVNQPRVILRYLALVFWPTGLCLDHEVLPARSPAELIPGGVALALLLGGIVRAWRRRPVVAFLGASFLVLLAPSSSCIPLFDLMVEHRMYLALAVPVTLVVLAVAAGLRRTALSPRTRTWLGAGLVLVVGGLLASLTHQRHADYADEVRMWRDVTRTAPHNARGYHNLARALVERGAPGDVMEAYAHALQAVHLEPRMAEAHACLGELEARRGHPEQALGHYRVASRIDPTNHRYQNNLGLGLVGTGQLTEALTAFRESLSLHPGFAEAHHNLGSVLARLGRLAEALVHLRRAVELDPARPGGREALGRALLETGHVEEAVAYLGAAVTRQPEDAARRLQVARARLLQGEPAAAVAQLQEVLRREPGQPAAAGLLTLAERQAARAIEGAREGLRWVPGDPYLLPARPAHPGSDGVAVLPTRMVGELLRQDLRVGVLLVEQDQPVPVPVSGQDLFTVPVILHPDLAVDGLAGTERLVGFGAAGSTRLEARQLGVTLEVLAGAAAVPGVAPATAPGALLGLALGHELVLITTSVDHADLWPLWYDLLGCGFRVPVIAGSGWPRRGPQPGAPLTLVAVEGPLTYRRWIEGIGQGRTVIARSRAHLLACTVQGALPGGTVTLPAGGGPVTVTIATRLAGPDRAEVIVSGAPVAAHDVPAGVHQVQLEVPVTRSAWLAVRTSGAHTGVVNILVGDQGSPRSAAALDRLLARLREVQERGEAPREVCETALARLRERAREAEPGD
jgi:tetratricopeptide (TPR) repeat protein